MWPCVFVLFRITLTHSSLSEPSASRTWSPEWSPHLLTLKANPGPWLHCPLTSASAGAPPLCCKRQTLCWTWQPPFRPLRASRWLLSAPAAAAAFSTASWPWRSWSAWPLLSWLGTWSPWLSLCKRGNPERRRDTWKVNVRAIFPLWVCFLS